MRCSLCGTAQWEWDENRRAYEVVAHDCQGCYSLEYMQDTKDRHPGRRMQLAPTGTIDSAKRAVAAERAWMAKS